jgi:MFS family permease
LVAVSVSGTAGATGARGTFWALAFAGLGYTLPQSLFAPALPAVQAELGASTAATTWILTAYLLSAVITTPIAGRLGDMFGRRRTLLAVLGLLAAGSAIAAVADSLTVLVAGRVLQGSAGAVFPLAFAILRDTADEARASRRISILSTLMGIGGGLGVVLAGPVLEHLSWHWLSWSALALTLAAMVAVARCVPATGPGAGGRVDLAGLTALAAWMTALLLAISWAPTRGWADPAVLALALCGVLGAGGWVALEHRVAEPLVDMRLMRSRALWTANVGAALFGASVFAAFILIPQLVQSPASGFAFGATVTEAGLFLIPMTLAMLAAGPLGDRLARRTSRRAVLQLSAVFVGAGSVALMLAHATTAQIVLGAALLGVGVGGAYATLANVVIDAVPPGQTAVASGVNTTMRLIGGATGTQIAGTILVATADPAGASTGRGFAIAFGVGAVVAVATLAVTSLMPDDHSFGGADSLRP